MPYSALAVTQWFLAGRSSFGFLGYERASKSFSPDSFQQDLRGQNHIVTGGNAGLGLATATALANMNATVHLVCRDKARGEEALQKITSTSGTGGSVHLHIADLSSTESVKQFASSWIDSKQPIDVLINNAGAMLKTREVNADGNEISMASAVNGTYLLTSLLLPALKLAKNPRVINVSSGGGLTVKLDVNDLNCEKRAYDGTEQYAHAKRAQMHLTELFARKGPSNASFYSMHPGWAATPGVQKSLPEFFDGKWGKLRTSEQGADTIVWLAAAKPNFIDKSANGKFFFDRAPVSQHYFLGGTSLTSVEEEQLWTNVQSMCKHRWEG